MDENAITMEYLDYKNTRYAFKAPEAMKFLLMDGNTWTVYSFRLGISGFGKTKGEALESLKEDMDVCYREFALENDSRLSQAALEYKKDLLNMVTCIPLPRTS